MRKPHLTLLRRSLPGFASIALLCFAGKLTAADKDEKGELSRKALVFVYPERLTEKDKLVDGPGDKASAIEIKSETTLIWVDLQPDYRFAHATEYILISPEGTRVLKGKWWPVLNGKRLFAGDRPYTVELPLKLFGK